MPISTKAEAEALSMAELKTELEGRGLPTEGLKAVMLETLLSHLDTAANGEPAAAPAAEEEAPKKDEAAPEEPAAESAADASAPTPEVTEVAAPAEETAETPAAEEAGATRTVDEVSGGTEEPGAKKVKADADADAAPEDAVEIVKTVEAVAEEAPSSEPAAAPAVE